MYERDTALAGRQQGYRLHLDRRAGLALQHCLPPELFELFLATCGRPSNRFTVMSQRLRVLHEVASDPGRDPYEASTLATSVNRQTFRDVLAAGLDQKILFGCELTRFEPAEGGVRLHFADGGHADADLLVGADGVNSAVRRQHLPDADVIDTGSRCIYGKTPLSESAQKLVPPPLFDGFTAVVGGQAGMAAGLVQFRQHPDLRGLLGLADIDQTFLVRIRTSVPTPAWQPSRVTLLGDAIHAMSPARGSGANTALQGAGLLCQMLTDAAPDGRALVAAIGQYEAQMRQYGYAAVQAARQAEAAMAVRRGSLKSWLYRHLARSRASSG